jgi:outer membrane protein TolC
MVHARALVIGAVLTLSATRPATAQELLTFRASASVPLAELIEEALRANPDLRAARLAIQAAQARIVQARSLDDPELDLESWAIPLRAPTNVGEANTHMVNIRQRLPFPGKRRLRGEVAVQEEAIARARYRAKEREVIAAVKRGYHDLFMADRTIEITQEQLEIHERILKTAEARYVVGKVAQADVIRAQAEHSDLTNRLILAEQERRSAEARLNAALNRPIEAPIGPTAEVEPPTIALEYEALARWATTSSPDLQAAASAIKRAERSRELAVKHRRYPDVTLGLGYWYVPQGPSHHTYSGMLTLTIPFFWTTARHDQEVEEASIELVRAEASYQAVRNVTLLDIRDSLLKADAARQSLTLYRTGLLPQAELAFRSAEAAYTTGRLEFTGLLEAERALRDVRLGYYRALVALQQSLADLERAVGRDLAP